MTKTGFTLAALLALAACGENSNEPSSEPAVEAVAPQDTQFAGDIAAAIREAAADTEAAAREAGVAPVSSDVSNAATDEPAADDTAQ